jgi:hypothetical protein
MPIPTCDSSCLFADVRAGWRQGWHQPATITSCPRLRSPPLEWPPSNSPRQACAVPRLGSGTFESRSGAKLCGDARCSDCSRYMNSRTKATLPPRERFIRDVASGLLRTLLPRTRVNSIGAPLCPKTRWLEYLRDILATEIKRVQHSESRSPTRCGSGGRARPRRCR